MGNAVVHFEIEGRDGEALQRFYSDMFGWLINADNPARYGLVSREENVSGDGVGIGGAVFEVPETPSSSWRGPTRAEGYQGHVTIFVEVDDVETALAQAERLGGTRLQGPDEVMGGLTMGKFSDPEGHLIGLISTATA
ncbi:VOC family protein [Actinomadura litoris]|uniref:VOC family protein n=1 Tax=Actinomadura litoris TaxID=2678616 RepID=UPI001FA725DF|nr:VOC family protein [Actinomadura litoris]